MVILRESINRTNPPIVIVTDWATLLFVLLVIFTIVILSALGLHYWTACPHAGQQQWVNPGHPQHPPNNAVVGGWKTNWTFLHDFFGFPKIYTLFRLFVNFYHSSTYSCIIVYFLETRYIRHNNSFLISWFNAEPDCKTMQTPCVDLFADCHKLVSPFIKTFVCLGPSSAVSCRL